MTCRRRCPPIVPTLFVRCSPKNTPPGAFASAMVGSSQQRVVDARVPRSRRCGVAAAQQATNGPAARSCSQSCDPTLGRVCAAIYPRATCAAPPCKQHARAPGHSRAPGPLQRRPKGVVARRVSGARATAPGVGRTRLVLALDAAARRGHSLGHEGRIRLPPPVALRGRGGAHPQRISQAAALRPPHRPAHQSRRPPETLCPCARPSPVLTSSGKMPGPTPCARPRPRRAIARQKSRAPSWRFHQRPAVQAHVGRRRRAHWPPPGGHARVAWKGDGARGGRPPKTQNDVAAPDISLACRFCSWWASPAHKGRSVSDVAPADETDRHPGMMHRRRWATAGAQ